LSLRAKLAPPQPPAAADAARPRRPCCKPDEEIVGRTVAMVAPGDPARIVRDITFAVEAGSVSA